MIYACYVHLMTSQASNPQHLLAAGHQKQCYPKSEILHIHAHHKRTVHATATGQL